MFEGDGTGIAPQFVCTVVRDSQVLGHVVIDSFIGQRATGGLRMLPDVSETEIRDLARAMTLKYGFLGIPRGGAKAGVRGDPEAPEAERRQRLSEFARAIAPLLRHRIYAPATDMGTMNADIRFVLETAGVRVPRRERHNTQSGPYTAHTVFVAMQRAARHLDLDLSACRVAIEGFGKVGAPLARLVHTSGARVVAISTSHGALYDPRGLDVPRLIELAAQFGSRVVEMYRDAERLDCAALLELPVEILAPCARGNSIHAGNAVRVAARLICPGANNPLTPDAERALFARGVLCVPDFVANCGGVLGSIMEYAAVSPARIVELLERRIGARIAWLLQTAAAQNVPPREIAEVYAMHRVEQMQRAAAQPTLTRALFGLGQEIYRHGWIPRTLVAPLAQQYFERIVS